MSNEELLVTAGLFTRELKQSIAYALTGYKQDPSWIQPMRLTQKQIKEEYVYSMVVIDALYRLIEEAIKDKDGREI